MKKIILSILLIGAIILAVVFAVSRSNPQGSSEKLQVATSFYPLYNFAENIGGDKVVVTNLTPTGTEPHDYEPSPKTLTELLNSPVFIYNGGHLEPWVDNFLKDYTHTAVKASQNISLLESEGTQDPHFWLDPVLAQTIVSTIRDAFVQADPGNANYYKENAAAYTKKLVELDTAYSSGLKECQLRTVISSHEAFSYLGKRYNVTIEAIAGISPEEEPSAAALAKLSALVKEKNIRYIFFESLASPRLAATIATETGAKTLVFNPIEGLTDEEQKAGKDYLDIQYQNLDNLRTALACQ